MKEFLKQLAKGNFIYNPPKLELPAERLKDSITAGSCCEQTFVLKAPTPVKGLVWSDNTRISVDTAAFSGVDIEIKYKINAKGLDIGGTISGCFQIVSSAGEAQLDYEFKVIGEYFKTGTGRADNLFHFANLVQTASEEARTLFNHPHFKKVFLHNDTSLSNIYEGIHTGDNQAEAVEEFLIAAHKKMPVSLTISNPLRHFDAPVEDIQDTIMLTKSCWGYVSATVDTDCPFIQIEENEVTAEQFTGNHYELRYVLMRSQMHAGRNFGRIVICTFRERLTVEIEVDCAGQERSLKEKRKALHELTRIYLDYRMKKTDTAGWVEQSNQILDRIRGLGCDDTYFKLAQAQLYFVQHRQQEGEWLLEHARKDLEACESVEIYCYYLYVHSLVQRDPDYTGRVAAKVKHYYENGHDSWRMLWLLFYMDSAYGQNQSIKLLRIKDVCHNGCTSPVMYMEALTVMNAQPALLRVLNRFELQVLNFGCKYRLISEKLALQAADLIGGEKVAAAPMLKILSQLYHFYEKDQILTVLVTHMIRNELTGPACFDVYEKGVLRGLRITQLYEFYMKSMDNSRMSRLPKMVLMYFTYDSALDYETKAYLYANILMNDKNSAELMNVYRPQIERFVYEQLKSGHVNGPLLTVYQHVWSAQFLDEQTAVFMSRFMFTYKVTCFAQNIQYVQVKHKELREAVRYPLVNGTAYIQMYTDYCAVLFEDAKGVCRKDSLQYEIERMFDDESLLKQLFERNQQDVYLRLYLYENRKRYGLNSEEVLENIRWLMRCPAITDETRTKINSELIDYYAAVYDGDDFRSCFAEIQKEELLQKDAVKLIELCVHQALYEDAFDLIKDYAFEQVSAVDIFRLALRILELRGFEDDDTMLMLCRYVFQHRKYNEDILQYLAMHFNGSNEQMYQVWKACRNFKVPCQSFSERLIAQMLFTGEHNGRLTEVFGDYYSNGARNEIIRAYIAYHSFLYFVRSKKVNEIVFRVLEQELEEDRDWLDICKLTLLKYYSGRTDGLSEGQKKMARELLDEMCVEHKYFAFFKKFAGLQILPYNMLDQTVLEYRADPSAKVEIHYTLNNDESSEQTALMYCCGGVFVKNFTLFYGDSLQYYFTEEYNGAVKRCEPMHLLCSHINPEQTEGRFDYLNDMLASRELHDMVTMKKLMHGYVVQDYVGSQLFKRW